MRQAVKSRRLAVLLAVAATGLVAAGVSYAVIPDANGVVHGCYDTKTGALRVIDPSQGQTCVPKENPLSWNQTGPTGPTGPQGPQGQQGPAGPGVPAVATIAFDGTVNSTFSRNVTQANVTHPQTGVYCIGGLSFQPKIAVGNGRRGLGTVNGSVGFTNTDTIVTANVIDPSGGNNLFGCAVGDQVEVLTYSTSQGALVDRGFQVSLED
jgi:hypothetical protein